MLFTDLLPALLGQHPTGVPMPLGGPMLPPIAKSPSNATVTPTLAAHNVPPALDPASLMNAITNSQLKNLESQRLEWQIQQMKDVNANDFPAIRALYGLGGAGTTMPGTNGSAFGGSLSSGGGETYWTPEGLAALRPTEGQYDQIHYPSGYTKGGVKSSASGGYGFLDSTWQQQAPLAGVDITKYPRAYMAPPEVQDKVAAITPIHHWTGVDANGKPFNSAAQKLAANPDNVTGATGAALPDSPEVTHYGGDLGPTPLATAMAAAPQMAGGSAPAPAGPRDPLDLRPYFPAEEPPPSQAAAGNGGAATPTTVTPLGGSAQPVVPTQAPPAFGSLAPGGMPSVPQPGANPQMVAAANMLRKAMAMSMAGLPAGQIMAQSVYNSPAFKAAVAGQSKAAEMGASIPYLQETARQTKLGEGTPLSQAVDAAKRYPVGSPERAQADAAIAKAAGISPVIGGERPGVPIQKWNSATQSYDIIGQVPRTGEGMNIGPGGSVSVAPGYPPAATTVATAAAPPHLVPGVGLVSPGMAAQGVTPGGQPSANTPGVLAPTISPGQQKTLDENMAIATKQRDSYQAAGAAARDQVANAAGITDLLDRVKLGWGANTVQQGARILSSLGVSDESVKQFLGTNPAAGDELNKLFLKFSADAVRQMGAREPGSVISLFTKAFPNLETMPKAAEMMTNVLRMQAQHKVDMANEADKWLSSQQQGMGRFGENFKGMLGFDQEFAKSHDPRDYWKAAAAMSNEPDIAWQNASAADKQRIYDLIPPGTVFRASNGQQYRKPGG